MFVEFVRFTSIFMQLMDRGKVTLEQISTGIGMSESSLASKLTVIYPLFL